MYLHVRYLFFIFLIVNQPNKKHTVKPVLSGHSKIYKRKVLMATGSLMMLMKVESIAQCLEYCAILLTCI